MSGSWKIKELKHAKELLRDNFSVFYILRDHKDRRDSPKPYRNMMAMNEDVLDALNDLENNGVAVKLYAEKWHRVPNVKPEEIGDLNIAEKLGMLEAKFKVYDRALNYLKADAIKTEDGVANLETDSST